MRFSYLRCQTWEPHLLSFNHSFSERECTRQRNYPAAYFFYYMDIHLLFC